MLSGLSPNTRGMIAMTGSASLFVINDSLVKIATKSWPVSQIMSVRGAMAIILSLGVVTAMGLADKSGKLFNRLIGLRTFFEALVAILFISALSRMPLADLTSLLMASPLVITALAVLLLGEVVGWRRWLAILTGFCGMLLVIQPWGASERGPEYGFAVVLAIGSVLGVGFRDLVTRRLNDDIPSLLVMLATSLGSCLAGLLMSPFETWAPFSWPVFLALFGAAITVTAGNYCLIIACRGVDLSVVAPYRYSAVIWAILIGMFTFGDVPNTLAFAGMALIVGSGLYAMHRERVRRLEAEKNAAK